LLTTLLNGLGGDTLTALLNSVSEPDNVIDGELSTYAPSRSPPACSAACSIRWTCRW